MSQDQSVWLTRAQVAARLHTTERTITKLVKEGKLPAMFLSRREGYRIRASDVDALVSGQSKDTGEA